MPIAAGESITCGVLSGPQRAPHMGSIGKSRSSHTLPLATQEVPKPRTMSCVIEDTPISKGKFS